MNSADLRASRAESDARVAEAEADIRFYEREDRRERALLAENATTPQNLDVNLRGLEFARARRTAAVACRDRFDALIAKTRITAPIDGVVTARHVQPGEIAEPGRAVVTIADLNRLRIEAEVDEFDTARVALGSPVPWLVNPRHRRFFNGQFPPFSRPILTLTGPVGSGCQTCVLASFPVFCLLSSQGRLVLVSLRTCC